MIETNNKCNNYNEKDKKHSKKHIKIEQDSYYPSLQIKTDQFGLDLIFKLSNYKILVIQAQKKT